MCQSDKMSQCFDQSIYLYFKSDNVDGKPFHDSGRQSPESHRASTAQSQACPYGFCGRQGGKGIGLAQSTSVSLSEDYFTNAPLSYISFSLTLCNLVSCYSRQTRLKTKIGETENTLEFIKMQFITLREQNLYPLRRTASYCCALVGNNRCFY